MSNTDKNSKSKQNLYALTNMSFSPSQRYDLYKKMVKAEPRMWTRDHHALRAIGNLLVINLTIFTWYRYNFSINPNKQKMLYIIPLFLVNFGLLVLNYYVLPRYIYDNYYDSKIIKDDEYLIMFDNIINIKKK